nr:MAG TPA: hypothetical protein [Caudoviricetes sp.]
MLDVVYNFHNELEKAKESNKEYGNKIFEILNGKTNKNSRLNYEKVRRYGIEPNKPFVVNKEKNIICVVYPRKHGITKEFYWGKKYIKEETAMKRCNYVKVEV